MTKDQKQMLCDYKWMIEDELFKDLGKDMKACACDYHRHKMLSSIIGTIKDIDCIMETYDKKGASESYSYTEEEHALTPDMAVMWASSMQNSDGTMGAHWTLEQTTAVAEQYGVMFDHITPTDWMVTLNMIYSDYGKTLSDAGITDVATYVHLAKNFLFDPDAVSPKEKLYCYYKYIVKK